MSAEIIWLCDRQADPEAEPGIDMRTAIDVAVRDLREIRGCWGTDQARERLLECEAMLRQVLADT